MYGDPQKFFELIAEKSFLREGSKGVFRIIVEMYRRKEIKVNNKELARIVGIPVPVLSAVRGELLKNGFLETKSKFSQSAIKWIEQKLGLCYSIDFFDEFNAYPSSTLAQKYLDFFTPVIEFLNKRPPPEYKFDQSRGTIETVLRRALLMLQNGDIEGKKIVILGDDDGVSIALAFFRAAKEIFVIDIDQRILDIIKLFAKQQNLTNVVKTQCWDIRTSLPVEWHHNYETFETDPPYTLSGFKLFLEQAITLLMPFVGGKGYISFGNKNPFETWNCQQYLIEAGFKIDEYIPNFNQYQGASILGNTSNLYVLSTVPQKFRRLDKRIHDKEIYTFNEKRFKDLPTVGYQIIAEFYGVKPVYLNDVNLLTKIMHNGVDASKLHREETFIKEYSPYGVSIIIILIESHCNLHTWPEHNYLSLDIFVCDEKEKAEQLFLYLLNEINPIDYHKFQFFRGKSLISE